MNNVISVLEKIACDSTFNNLDIATSAVEINKLSKDEKNCFLNNDSASLSIIAKDIPSTECSFIFADDDDESYDVSTTNHLTANNNLSTAINA
jgi:hypothetical protein